MCKSFCIIMLEDELMETSVVSSDKSEIISDDEILECSYFEDEVSHCTIRSKGLINLLTPKKPVSHHAYICSPMSIGTPQKEERILISSDESPEKSVTNENASRNSCTVSKDEIQESNVIEISDDSDVSITENVYYRHDSDGDCMEVQSPFSQSVNFVSNRERTPLQEVTNSTPRRPKDLDFLKKRQLNNLKPSSPLTEAPSLDISDDEECESLQLSFLSSLSEKTHGLKCDPVALYFKANFKRTRPILAQHLYCLYNELVFKEQLPKTMPIKWNSKLQNSSGITTTLKNTDEDGNVVYSVYITLSKKIITTAERLRDTLIHEMCHAAVWVVNKSNESHGPVWKMWALKARLIFPELPKITRCHNYVLEYNYLYECSVCEYRIGRSRRSEKIENARCGFCGGCFVLKKDSSKVKE